MVPMCPLLLPFEPVLVLELVNEENIPLSSAVVPVVLLCCWYVCCW